MSYKTDLIFNIVLKLSTAWNWWTQLQNYVYYIYSGLCQVVSYTHLDKAHACEQIHTHTFIYLRRTKQTHFCMNIFSYRHTLTISSSKPSDQVIWWEKFKFGAPKVYYSLLVYTTGLMKLIKSLIIIISANKTSPARHNWLNFFFNLFFFLF